MEPRTGNPLNAVLAASTRIRPVTMATKTAIHGTLWNTADESWLITGCCTYEAPTGTPFSSSWVFGSSANVTPVARESSRIDMIITIDRPPSRARVVAAFLDLGFLNAG